MPPLEDESGGDARVVRGHSTVTPPNRPVGVQMLVKAAEVMTTLPAPRRALSPQPAPTPIRQPTGTRTSSATLRLRFRRLAVSLLSPMSPGKLTVACAW